MATRPPSMGDGCVPLLDHVQEPLCPPAMEPDSPSPAQDSRRTSDGDSGGAKLGGCDMVSAADGDGDRSASDPRPDHPHTNDFAFDSVAMAKPRVEALRLAAIRRKFRLLGFSKAMAERHAHAATKGARPRSYQRAQAFFLAWCEQFSIDVNQFSAADLIEFLDHAARAGYAVSTVTLFRSAVMAFHTDGDALVQTRVLRDFMSQLKKQAPPVPISKPVVDLSPSLSFLRTIPSSASTPLHQLASKCAFLLAAAAFLRPSDLARISLQQSSVQQDGSLRLVIVAPKETRDGYRIVKDVTIHPLARDPVLCPVQAFQALVDHPIRTHATSLFVNSRKPDQPLASTTLSSYLHRVLSKSPSAAQGSRLPSVRSVASDAALRGGVALDDILLMGNWSSSTVFDHHYRRSRQVATNMSAAVLSPSH